MNTAIDQLEHELNLCGELFQPNVKLLIAWIANEMTVLYQQNFDECFHPAFLMQYCKIRMNILKWKRNDC